MLVLEEKMKSNTEEYHYWYWRRRFKTKLMVLQTIASQSYSHSLDGGT